VSERHLEILKPEVASFRDPTKGVLLRDWSTTGSVRAQQPGRCHNYNGTTQYTTVPNMGVVGATSLTLMCWFTTTVTGSVQDPMRSRPTGAYGTQRGWLIQQLGSNVLSLGFEDASNNFVNVQGGSGFQDGLWHLVLGTFDTATGTAVLYLDNVQVGTGTNAAMIGGDLDSVAGTGYIAASPVPSQYWTGNLFHVGVIKRVITEGERNALYQQGKRPEKVIPRQPTDYADLMYLDEDSQTVAYNAVGSRSSGTIVNGSAGLLYTGKDVPYSPQNLRGYTAV
jgi:hypothetical protein